MTRREVVKRILILGGGIATLTYFIKPSRFFPFPDLGSLKKQLPLLEVLVEAIIPKTASPGAKEAGVADFLVKVLSACTDQRTQNNFIHGLKELEEQCQHSYGRSFSDCSSHQKLEVLNGMEQSEQSSSALTFKVRRKLLGSPFIRTLKRFTVLGYCTSELGATQGLSYDLTPGVYVGTIELEPDQRAWATH